MAPYAVVDTTTVARERVWHTRLILLNSSKDRQNTATYWRGELCVNSVEPLFFGGAFKKKSPFLFATFSFGDAKEKVGLRGQDISVI